MVEGNPTLDPGNVLIDQQLPISIEFNEEGQLLVPDGTKCLHLLDRFVLLSSNLRSIDS